MTDRYGAHVEDIKDPEVLARVLACLQSAQAGSSYINRTILTGGTGLTYVDLVTLGEHAESVLRHLIAAYDMLSVSCTGGDKEE